MKPAWAVLISGRGSNLAAVLELQDEIDLRLVVSSSPTAYGLLRAERSGIPTALLPRVAGTKKIDWPALSLQLRERGITHIFLLGFMRVVPASFIQDWSARIFNLHPSLLPTYPGLDSITRAIDDRAAIGCSVHEVIEAVDAGRLHRQRETLSAKEVSAMLASGIDEGAVRAKMEFWVHLDEQNAVKELLQRWNRQSTHH